MQSIGAEQLEVALAVPDSQKTVIAALLLRLVRDSPSEVTNDELGDDWEQRVAQGVAAKYSSKNLGNPLDDRGWSSLSCSARLDVLHALCEWKIQDSDVTKAALGSTGEGSLASLLERVRIGEDSSGAKYYFIPGTDQRLYRETAAGTWETVSTTVDQIRQLAHSLAASEHAAERSLHAALTGTILPGLATGAAPSGAAGPQTGHGTNTCGPPVDKQEAGAKTAAPDGVEAAEAASDHPLATQSAQEQAAGGLKSEPLTAPVASAFAAVAGATENGDPAGPALTAASEEQPGQPGALPPEGESAGTSKVPESQMAAAAAADGESPEPEPRRREFPRGWSPLGLDVPQKSRKLETKPATRLEPLVKVAKGRAEMAPRRSWHAPDEAPEIQAKEEEARGDDKSDAPEEEQDEEEEDGKPKHGIQIVKPGSRHRPSLKAMEMDVGAVEDDEDEEPGPARSGPRAHLSRHRPSRKRKEMDDVDYEEEEESEEESDSDSDSGYRPRSRAKRAQAAAAAKAAAAKRKRQQEEERHQPQSSGPSQADVEYHTAMRRLQEAERQRKRQIDAQFPHPSPQRNQCLMALQKQVQDQLALMKQRHARMKAVETASGRGSQAQSGDYGGYGQSSMEAQKAARDRQLAAQQQQQQLMQVMQSLTPQQRMQLQMVPQHQQMLFLERLRQQQLQLQQQQAQQQQQLQSQVLAQLSPEQIMTLRQMPRERQQETLSKLTQQYLLQQQQRSQMMQAQMQSAAQLGRGFPGGELQMQRMASAPRISSPNVPGAMPQAQPSPTMRSSSAMLGGAVNPMLLQEHRSLAMDSGMQGGMQRWASQQPTRYGSAGMIPTDGNSGFGVAGPSGSMQRLGSSPGLPMQQQGVMSQAQPSGMAHNWMAGSRASQLGLEARPGQLQGSSSPALMRGFPAAVEPVSHLGDDFGDLDSMLAGDAFIDKPDSRPPSRQPSRGPTDSASGAAAKDAGHTERSAAKADGGRPQANAAERAGGEGLIKEGGSLKQSSSAAADLVADASLPPQL